jgi:dolichol-phosphate mannosyltransferase
MLKIITDKIGKERVVRFLKFGIVGASGIFVNMFFLWLMHEKFSLPLAVASLIAVAFAILNNFLWNDFWTWSDKNTEKKYPFFHRLWRYYLSASLGSAINYVTLLILTEIFGVYYLLANLIGIFFGMTSNFLLGEFWVFKKKH